ncbi:hypothetical protein [Clostridium sp. CH2]|uniref:hypothetical protein n=1 Tax=Clostridium sp. CH2 TaxID=2949990 RepID=UPI0020796AFC|nr:hypothetical protein [Clostridium sp. CH2]
MYSILSKLSSNNTKLDLPVLKSSLKTLISFLLIVKLVSFVAAKTLVVGITSIVVAAIKAIAIIFLFSYFS